MKGINIIIISFTVIKKKQFKNSGASRSSLDIGLSEISLVFCGNKRFVVLKDAQGSPLEFI